MEDFFLSNALLQCLVFVCLYLHWVMIHMLVRDGERGSDACWPVREMWQRLVCRDKPESVACSSQSLRGLAETHTGSCPPSLSFISLSFALSIFNVSSISRSLQYFVTVCVNARRNPAPGWGSSSSAHSHMHTSAHLTTHMQTHT